MTKKQISKLEEPEAQTPVLQSSRTQGHFGNHGRTFWEACDQKLGFEPPTECVKTWN
jgi:hypothetical protein